MPKAKIRELKTSWQLRFYDAERSPRETTNSISKARFTEDEAREEWWKRWTLYKSAEHGFDPWRHATPEEASQYGPEKNISVGEAIDAYVEAKKRAGRRGEAGGWSEETRRRYKPTFEKIKRFYGPAKLFRHMRTEDIARFIHRDGLAAASKKSYRKMLGAWLNWMRRQGYSPPDLPPPLRSRKKVPAYCTPEELAKICKQHRKNARKAARKNDNPDAPTTEWMIDAWQFAFWQALRREELVAQRVGGIDLERGLMRVGDETFVPKGQDEAVIPIAGPALPIARKWCEGAAHTERLFRHKTAQYLYKRFKEAAKKAVPEKPRLTLHSLRHGRCVDLLQKGKPLQEVQHFMRHKSIKSTMVYVQVANAWLSESIQSLGEEGIDIDAAKLPDEEEEEKEAENGKEEPEREEAEKQ